MSSRAIEGLFGLDLKTQKVDGTMLAVLFYLAFRHDDDIGRAWPGLARIATDLSMTKGRVYDAIQRLKDAELVTVNPGRSRSSNEYAFPWLAPRSGRPDYESLSPRSGGPDREGWRSRSGGTSVRGRVEHSPAVGPARLKNIKHRKQGRDSETGELPPEPFRTPTDRAFAQAREARRTANHKRSKRE